MKVWIPNISRIDVQNLSQISSVAEQLKAKCSIVSIKGDMHLLQIVKSYCGTHVANLAKKYTFESSTVVLANKHPLKMPSVCTFLNQVVSVLFHTR